VVNRARQFTLLYSRRLMVISSFSTGLPNNLHIGDYTLTRHQNALLLVRLHDSDQLVGVLSFAFDLGNAILDAQEIWYVDQLERSLVMLDISGPVHHRFRYRFGSCLNNLDRRLILLDTTFYCINRVGTPAVAHIQRFDTVANYYGWNQHKLSCPVMTLHGCRSFAMLAANGLIYINNPDDYTISAINPKTKENVQTIKLPKETLNPVRKVDDIVIAGHFLFVAHRERREISVFDTRDGRRFGVFPTGTSPYRLFKIGSTIYVFPKEGNSIEVLDITSYLND